MASKKTSFFVDNIPKGCIQPFYDCGKDATPLACKIVVRKDGSI